MPPSLVVLVVKVLVVLHEVSFHLVKVQFVLNFLWDLMYWLLEHSTDYLNSSIPRMPRKVSPRLIIIVSIQPEISFILRDHFSFLLGTYFYVIGINFDKTHFICIWVNLSKFKMIITSG